MILQKFFLALGILFSLSKPSLAQIDLHIVSASISGLGMEDFEPKEYTYDFYSPVESELLCKNNYQGSYIGSIDDSGKPYCGQPWNYNPDADLRYFISTFGPRMTLKNENEITREYDFHRGIDIVDKSVNKTDENLPDIYCMCDGVIFEREDDEYDSKGKLTDEGKYLTILCDKSYAGNPSRKILISYRHLKDIEPGLNKTVRVKKKQKIGTMGQTGKTEVNHLHLSAHYRDAANPKNLINVNPFRLFNPERNKHLLRPVNSISIKSTIEGKTDQDQVHIFLLNYKPTTLRDMVGWINLRIAIPYDKTAIRAIVVKSGLQKKVFDLEKISLDRDGNEGNLNNPVVDDFTAFVYPFNFGRSTYDRCQSVDADLREIHEIYDLYPIESSNGIFRIPSLVFDLKVSNLEYLPPLSSLEVYVIDIWGNAVKGTLK